MKRVFILVTILSGFILPIQISAQTQEWVAIYNGPISDGGATAIALDSSGNVYVTGWSYSSGSVCDYATIKYNNAGDTMWVRRYNTGSGSANEATAIALDNSGNVYVTGYSNFSSGSGDYATIKYNSSGDTIWVRRYSGPGNRDDWASAIALDGSGNVYVTGQSDDSSTSEDYATIKYNSSGDTMWVRRYNGPANNRDYAEAIAVDGSGNVYVTGRSDDSGTFFCDYATIKYNSSGDTMWIRRYNGLGYGNNWAYAIAVDGSGNVYVTGQSGGSDTGRDYATIKYNSAGDTMWVRRYNGPGNRADYAIAIAVDGSGNVYVTGCSIGSGTGNDYATIKYNSSGDTMWVRRYNGPGNGDDYAYAIAVDGSGNVYVTGQSYISSGDDDYATIKYNASGDTMWVARYSGPGNSYDWATAIALDGSGCVYVTGCSDFCGTSGGYATIKYCGGAGTEENPKFQIQNPKLEMLPNPLTALTEIKYELPRPAYVKIELYNLAGRKVATLIEGKQSAGKQVCRLKGNEVKGSGIYFIKFSAGEHKEIKKVVLMK